MFKVICVGIGLFDAGVPELEIGTVYHVVNMHRYNYKCKPMDFYVLAETGEDNAYAEILFAPASDIDETEMVREYETATA